ncbi:MAG: Mpv17/PMP22 family protein, partial [Bacteroidales bacterium]|nr:Mpv17/PMP22 family protein [Bacteroidales bacterium]
FLKFVVGKTIPLFWIPAHTITFMLPDQYKVLFAASLSIVLGLILSYAKLRNQKIDS